MTNISDPRLISTVNVTDDRVAHPNVWVAALVQTNCERSVAAKFDSLSIENYVAAQEEMHRWSDRMKKVQRLVIHNIVFVRTTKERFAELKRYSFVRGLLTNPGQREPAVIPDQQIQTLQYMLGHSDTPVFLDNDSKQLKLGGKVRVIRGSMRGVEGTICRLREGDLHVGIHISSLGFAHVRVNVNDIQKI